MPTQPLYANPLYATPAQNLLTQLQHMRISIRLCPRAALTAEAPCGHFIRAWAVAAPSGPPAAGPGTLVSASGHVISSSTGHPLSSRLRASSIASSTLTNCARASLALPSGAAIGSGRHTSRLLSARSGPVPLRHPRRSIGGDSGSRSLRLSGSWRAAGGGGGGGAPFSGLSPFARQGSLQVGGGAAAPLGTRLRPHATELMRTAAANLSGAVVGSSLFSGRAAAEAVDESDSGWEGDWEADTGTGAESEDPTSSAFGWSVRLSEVLEGASAAGSAAAAVLGVSVPNGSSPSTVLTAAPGEGDAIVASAYIDGTLAAGGAYGGDGRLLDASLSGARPTAAHGFDRVVGGCASTFQDVLEVEAEAAQAAYVVFVDENVPSVLEVRGAGCAGQARLGVGVGGFCWRWGGANPTA
jgi:hypothetical protein